ncbi:hypothetical protein GC197_14960 [bacterium]|nr:hypothetical protein [bacterium]
MGLWSTIKGWFNIGGVSVQIVEVDDPFPHNHTMMNGKFVLTTKTAHTILGITSEFFLERTTKDKEGNDQTEKTSLGVERTTDIKIRTDFPFELTPEESKELTFHISDIDMDGVLGKMAKSGGMMGMLGQAAKFAGSFSDKGIVRYYVEVTADVKGTPFDPSDKREIRVGGSSS